MVKLSGFGIEDTHSVMNSSRGAGRLALRANGSTTTARWSIRLGQDGGVAGQMIWRFDPKTERFEIFAKAEATHFSLEIDGKGTGLFGHKRGKTRGMFYPQGSYGSKSWGKHGPLTNPYAFGFFEHMKHEGDERRFPQTFTICEGGFLVRGTGGPHRGGERAPQRGLVEPDRARRIDLPHHRRGESGGVAGPLVPSVFAGLGRMGRSISPTGTTAASATSVPSTTAQDERSHLPLHPSGKNPVYRKGTWASCPPTNSWRSSIIRTARAASCRARTGLARRPLGRGQSRGEGGCRRGPGLARGALGAEFARGPR